MRETAAVWRRLLAFASGTLLLGCGVSEPAGEASPTPVSSTVMPTAISETATNAPSTSVAVVDLGADVSGRLAFDAATGCYFLSNQQGAVAVAWPEGVTKASDGSGVVTRAGTRIDVGALVSGAGGFFPIDVLPASGLQAECLAGFDRAFVFNMGADVRLVSP